MDTRSIKAAFKNVLSYSKVTYSNADYKDMERELLLDLNGNGYPAVIENYFLF